METEFNPLTTAHIELQIEEEFPEIRLEAEKFELWFQPVYELSTGKVLHNEVLFRWRDEKGDLRQPQELLMALQNTQLLKQLDRIVVEKSIAILSKQASVTVSINLSNEIFEDHDFLTQLHKWLMEYQVKPPRISFEIEESMLSQNQALVLPFMTELRMMGCSVVIDNFTGKFFPLSQLQELPVNIIKLDRSFALKPLTLAQKQLAMAISYTSKVFQKQTVLKGIDDNLSLKFANDLGIKGVQGYSLSRPQNKPKTFGLVGLILVRIIAVLIVLYIIKSFLGINFFQDRHAWEVIIEFIQSLFDGK
ncbi:EAL domain-containing protein [Pseudanabaena mucicola]|uniref:EAL domain-containing protein n=1 Tax=Pseudanabaena mucicola FACHB-723 TaxID=2692860 RepID=A0ABR8A0C6_9CYAN|nr:EAL domain-containing protein [Pseudanabaena mucicola]MBD2188802.1 EAL domain-containing protein [Pseudanabaena mucicola FACHB-723]